MSNDAKTLEYLQKIEEVRKAVAEALWQGLAATVPALVEDIGANAAAAVTFTNASVILVDALVALGANCQGQFTADKLKVAVMGSFAKALHSLATNDLELIDPKDVQ